MHTPQIIIMELCLQGAALCVSDTSSKGMADIPSGLAFHKAEIMGKR